MKEVGIWQRFEAALANSKPYANPFRDVELAATFRRPDGSSVRFWGFHDGERRWRVRFMPDQIGRWRYRARFSDGAAQAEGEFDCVSSNTPGMIASDETNPLWFGYKGGKHVLLRSLHIGDSFFAANLAAEQRRAFLDWAQGQGYNMLSVASHYLNRAEPGRGQGWDTPRLWPLDPAEFRRAEAILDDLAERGLIVYPFAGFFGRGANFPTERADELLYVRYLLARWGAYWNILFNVAGPEPLLVKKPFLSKDEVSRLGRLIRSHDVFGHPISVHNATGDDKFMAEDWPTYGILQGPKTIDLAVLSAGLRESHHAARPLYVQETLWSGNMHGHPDYSDEQLRRNALVILMSAGVINFSDNGGPDPAVRGDSSSGFSGSLHLADRRQWRHDIVKQAWDIFESLPFYAMKPAQQLVSRGFCLAQPGKQYLVYLPEGGAVDLKLEGGAYNILWISGTDPCTRRSGGQTNSGAQLTAPDEGDWLAYLWR